MKFAHQHGTGLIEEYEGDYMRMNGGIVEIIARQTFVDSEGKGFSTLEHTAAFIALGPGESVRSVPEEVESNSTP